MSLVRIDQAINNANSIKDILDVLEHGKTTKNPNPSQIYISFWADRKVTVAGYEGSVNLALVIQKILMISEQMKYEFTDQDREWGERLVKIIDILWEDSKQQEAAGQLGYVARLILFISYCIGELNPMPSTQAYIGWFINWDKDLFEVYGREQYIAKFGKEPTEHRNSSAQNFLTWRAPSSYCQRSGGQETH